MVEFVNETVSVETRLRQDGMAIPKAFVWRGRRYQITSWGRESATTRNGRAFRCHLAQTADLESWELCHDLETGGWILARRWPREWRAV